MDEWYPAFEVYAVYENLIEYFKDEMAESQLMLFASGINAPDHTAFESETRKIADSHPFSTIQSNIG